jgi:hypothetical protein
MQDFSATDWPNCTGVERDNRHRGSFSGDKLNFKGIAIPIAVNDSADIATYELVFAEIMGQSNKVQFVNHCFSPRQELAPDKW